MYVKLYSEMLARGEYRIPVPETVVTIGEDFVGGFWTIWVSTVVTVAGRKGESSLEWLDDDDSSKSSSSSSTVGGGGRFMMIGELLLFSLVATISSLALEIVCINDGRVYIDEAALEECECAKSSLAARELECK